MTASRVVALVLLCAVSSHGIAIDCSLPQNEEKCRPRTGTPKLPHSEALQSTLKDVVSQMDSFTSSSGGRRSVTESLSMQLESAKQQAEFIRELMQERQAEIDLVATSLVSQAHARVAKYYAAAAALKDNSTTIMQRIRQTVVQDPAAAFRQQQTIVQVVDRLEATRDAVEAGFFAATARPAASLIHKSMSVAQVFNRAVIGAARDDDIDDDDTSLLEIGAKTSFGLADRAIRILDQLVAEFKQLRVISRESATHDREEGEEAVDYAQHALEAFVTRTHFLHAEASQDLMQIQQLSQYLSRLTAAQYGALSWYETVQNSVQSSASMLDHAMRMIGAATPVFDELLHYLTEGDKPFTRTLDSAYSCSGRIDACGLCGGNNSTCTGCDGQLYRGFVVDVCGTCVNYTQANANCAYFCDGKPNSGKVEDVCGVCGGDNTHCMGCDGVPNGAVFDRCGDCGGDGMQCDKAVSCRNVNCVLSDPVACPEGKRVTSKGYRGCCFDPAFDCENV